MTLRVSPGFKRLLDNAAKREQRSRTNFLEKLVVDYCRSLGLSAESEAAERIEGSTSSSREEVER